MTVSPISHTSSRTDDRRRVRAVPDPAPPPNDRDAEQAVLSCAVQSPRALAAMAGQLTPEDFYDHTHRKIAHVLIGMWRAGQPVDLVTLRAQLADLGYLDTHGGDIPTPYLVEILEAAPLVAHYPAYAARVTTLAFHRKSLDAGAQLMTGLQTPGTDPAEVAARTAARLQELLIPRDDHDMITGTALLDELHQLVDLANTRTLARWGLKDLDACTRGLVPGRLILVAARPAVGKSSLIMQAAAHVARATPVLVFSYEMHVGEVAAHLVAAPHRLPLKQVMSPDGLANPKIVAAQTQLAESPVTVLRSRPDIDGLVAAATAAHARTPLGLIVVDYLQLIPTGRASRAGNREQHVSEVSRALKLLAADLQVPVLVASQLNRESTRTSRAPVLSDLRESGSLEQDSDQVILLHKESRDDRVVDVEVAKSRMGPTGAIRLSWNPESTSFGDLA